MANLGDVSVLNINGNELSIKDAALTEIVNEIIEAIGANNNNIAERINNLHDRSFDAEIKISSANETEISNIIDGLYKLQYVTITGEGTEATETLNNSAILIQKGTNQYLIKDGQILSRTKTNDTWSSWASTISLVLSSEYEMSDETNRDLILEAGDTYEEAFGKLEKARIDNEKVTAGAINDLNEKVEDIPIYDATNKLSADYIEDGTINKVINVKPDWNATSGSATEILNKPTIPAAQIQADWNQTTTTSLDYIKNKPDITQSNSPFKQITISGVSNTIVVGDTASIGRNNSKIEIGSNGGDDETIRLTTNGGDGGVYVSTDTQKFYYNNKEVATKNDIPTTSTSVTENDTNPVSGGAVYSKFADLIGTAPAALDTLGEIADALNDDANLAGTLTTQINSKIPKVSNPTTDNFASFNSDGTIKDSGVSASSFITTETQSDWEEADTTSAAYIQNKPTIKDELSSEYEMSSDSNDDLELEAGDTYEEAFGKLEKLIYDDEKVTAGALTDLDTRIDFLENNIGEDNVQADWKETDITKDSYILNKPDLSNFLTIETQPNWNETNTSSAAYIQNKPTIKDELSSEYEMSSDSNTDLILEAGDTYEEAFSKLEKARIDNEYVISSALNELNEKVEDIPTPVKPDWNATSGSAAEILNKPDLSNFLTIETQPNWNETNTSSAAYIQNKPTIPDDSNLVHKTGEETIEGLKRFYINADSTISIGNGEIKFETAGLDKTNWNWISYDGKGTARDQTLQQALDARNNVQADWNQTTTTAADYIKNKPTIPTTSTTVTQNDTNPVSGGAVYAKFADLIGSAPAALDTLQEIATALNNDADLAGTLTTQISSKVPKVSNPTTDNFASFNSDGTIKDSGHSHSDYITSIKTVNNESLVGTGNIVISGLPQVSASDNGKILMVVNGQWQLVSPSVLYSGQGVPNNANGNNGDLYMQTE